MGTLVFDMETNGLINDTTHIHCIVLHHVEANWTETFNDECPGKGMSSPVIRALQWLELADTIIGHNVIGFDIPVAKSLYNWFNPIGVVVDTLLLSRLYHPNLLDIDKKAKWDMPSKLWGRHSLEAYGYRLGERKGEFSKTTDWSEWSQEMEDYCVQDVVVTKKLCDHFHPYLSGSKWNIR